MGSWVMISLSREAQYSNMTILCILLEVRVGVGIQKKHLCGAFYDQLVWHFFPHWFLNLSTLWYTEVESKECFVLLEKKAKLFLLFYEEFTFMLKKYMTVSSKNVVFFFCFSLFNEQLSEMLNAVWKKRNNYSCTEPPICYVKLGLNGICRPDMRFCFSAGAILKDHVCHFQYSNVFRVQRWYCTDLEDQWNLEWPWKSFWWCAFEKLHVLRL